MSQHEDAKIQFDQSLTAWLERVAGDYEETFSPADFYFDPNEWNKLSSEKQEELVSEYARDLMLEQISYGWKR